MDYPLISVIVSIYNGEKFLNKCLSSIEKQDYQNIEVILINDGSIDNSLKICENFEEKDLRFKIINQKNHGVCYSRNKGIDVAKGEYITIVDQDDWIEKDYISYLYNMIIENECEIATVPQVILSTDKTQVYNDNPHKQIEIWTGNKVACEMLYANMEIGPWNKLIQKKLLKDNDISFHNELFGGEGFAFSVETFMASKKVAVGYKGIYHYRIDNFNSEMSNFRMRTAISSLNAIEIMKNEFFNRNNEINKALNFAKWDVYNVYLFAMLASGKNIEYNKEYIEWRKILKKHISILFEAPISNLRKMKSFLIIYFPKEYMFIRKIKNLFVKQKIRDYSKANS